MIELLETLLYLAQRIVVGLIVIAVVVGGFILVMTHIEATVTIIIGLMCVFGVLYVCYQIGSHVLGDDE